MIGKAYKLGTGFKGLAAYLERGHRDALQPDRVDWIESRNLPTRDPETAARLMAATARDSERVRKPVYHLSISFDPADPVNRETMRRVADRTLRDLGLQEHQALMVAHRDRQHPHVHIVVNRVHPERRTAWSNSWDYRRIEQSLRAQEADLGLRAVPGKHAPVPEHARERIRQAPERVRGDWDFVDRVRSEAGPHLMGARSWGELERGLAGHGLSLRMKGRGMVVTDGRQEVKASEIDPEASRYRLERRLGLYTDHRAHRGVASRTLEEQGARRAAAAPVERTPRAAPLRKERDRPAPPEAEAVQRAAARPPAPAPMRIPPAKVEHRRAARRYRDALRRLYVAPHRVHARFRDAVVRDGPEAAARTLLASPQAFGVLRPAAAPDPQRVREAAEEAYRWGVRLEAYGRPALRRVAAELREPVAYEQREEAQTAAERAKRELRWRQERRSVIRQQAHELAAVYENPRAALRRIARSVRKSGNGRTADLLSASPERFGTLRGVRSTRLLILQQIDHGPARQGARVLAGTLRALDFDRLGSVSRGDLLRARREVTQVERRLSELPRTRPPAVARLREIGRQLDGLQAAGHDLPRRLAPLLPTGAFGVARKALGLARTLAEGPERERGRGIGLDL